MKIISSRFERAASQAAHEPRAAGPDVIFLGRSNVGKSSLINRLLGVKNLARTSSQPGRTQTINFYRVNESCYFVDLPGYGYAKVPEAVRKSWGPMVEGFLDRRQDRIALALLVVDSRRHTTEPDLVMRDWLDAKDLPYLVAATKTDKLKASERARASRAIHEGFGGSGVSEHPIMASAKTGLGLREVWRHVDTALAGKGVRAS